MGLSEEAIGLVTQELQQSGLFSRDKAFIMTKSGYIPKNMLNIYDQDSESPHNTLTESHHEMINLTEINPIMDSYYSLEGQMHEQNIALSLDALQTDYIDVLFLHNPEHYIEFERKSQVAIPSFEDKLLNSFETLESEVKKGNIKSYGISCNWLSNPDEFENTKCKVWKELAHRAWLKVHDKKELGNEGKSSFKHIQMPGNLLETFGINHTAPWAKENGLNVFINRPLEAMDSKGQWRLATYSAMPHTKYMELIDTTLGVFEPHGDNQAKKFLATLVKDMERERLNYTSLYHYKYDFEHSIYPMVTEKLVMLRDANSVVAMQLFLSAYEYKVRERASTFAEDYIESHPLYKGIYSSKKTNLQTFAMEYLLTNKNIDCVLNGMLKEEYVDHALDLLHKC